MNIKNQQKKKKANLGHVTTQSNVAAIKDFYLQSEHEETDKKTDRYTSFIN